ncbi:MAG: alpha/beta hydrolase [Alphaproteobacteria bacterium]
MKAPATQAADRDRWPSGLVDIPAAELPPGGQAQFVRAGDGARLRVAVWRPASAGASVLLMPGRTEFIEKYGEVIGELMERGFAVGVMDWRGQGLSARLLSDPLRGHIDDFDTHVGDFAAMAAGPFASLPKPWIILAHSMGANIATNILLAMPDVARAAVFIAPMYAILTGKFPAGVARLIANGTLIGLKGRYVPGGTPTTILEETFAENIVTHDERRHARSRLIAEAEPRLALASPTIGFVRAAFAACDRISAPGRPEGLALPIFAAVAGEERLIDNAAARAVLARMPQAEVLEFAGARHEILMETDTIRNKFWSAFDTFLARTGLAGQGSRGTA